MSSSEMKLGVSPRRIAWAPCTIMLPAAWRKMWVSRVLGTAPAAISSANGFPAPTGASWSASPTSTTWVRGPTARSSVTSSSRLAIEVSSTISRSQFSGSCSSWVGPSPGTQPSAECTVVARIPLASFMRTAARPVGATSKTRACWAEARVAIVRIEAVLPVPGPPVISDSLCANAFRTPFICSSVRPSLGAAVRPGLPRRSVRGLPRRSCTRSASSASSSAVCAR